MGGVRQPLMRARRHRPPPARLLGRLSLRDTARAMSQENAVFDDKNRGLLAEVPPFTVFGGVTDDAWRWLNLEAREQCPFLADYLPRLTGKPEFEAELVGSSGAEALMQGFAIYELFKQLNAKYGTPLIPSSRVLDFGCGWGRVIRFFLKDVAPENLIGIDAHIYAVPACRETNRWCQFERCEVEPPAPGLDANSFDVVYAFSVFSHLSEKTHLLWLKEFARLLRPGGVLILTTFPRELFENGGLPDPDRFAPLEQSLAAYDRGEFCYRPARVSLFPFGDALIPEQYVRERWTALFEVREYFGASELGQNVIVCSKHA
jgi:SAM-dependent methyltransferase